MSLSKEKLEKQKQERLGEIRKSNEDYEMKIIEYNEYIDIIVEFQDKYKAKVHTEYGNFKKGNVKNPYHKNVYNIGYIGEGKYKVSENGKAIKVYDHWHSMLQRCYDPYYINKHLTYKDCFVCEEWLCFQNFAEWYYKNVYNCNNERMCLDKDILIKGNKIYSPENCIFLPQRINKLFIKRDKLRGEYPIGVHWDKKKNRFVSQCKVFDKENNNKQIWLGYYDTSEEAFLAYKQFKENYIKQVAEEYKNLIPNKLYEAMYKYEVDIND